MIYDCDAAVIGGGPAGVSAALNLVLRARSVKMFSNRYQDSGLHKAAKIDNYPGLPGISGAELLPRLYAHLKDMNVENTQAQVLSIARVGEGFYLSAGEEVCSARSVIIATGVVQTAFYPGETALLGHGVSYCASCDGMLYRGKRVAVLGLRGDAVEEANQLQALGCEVTFISAGISTDGLNPDIPVKKGKKFELLGDKKLSALVVDGVETEFDGLFIVRSSVAPELLLPGLETSGGRIVTDASMRTSIPGVFAAGDCTGKPHQISKAVGEGQLAAYSASAYLEAENESL